VEIQLILIDYLGQKSILDPSEEFGSAYRERIAFEMRRRRACRADGQISFEVCACGGGAVPAEYPTEPLRRDAPAATARSSQTAPSQWRRH
jgi:hypothetical protein